MTDAMTDAADRTRTAVIRARGLGSECPGHVPDVGPDGRLTEPQAQQNRVTVVTAE